MKSGPSVSHIKSWSELVEIKELLRGYDKDKDTDKKD